MQNKSSYTIFLIGLFLLLYLSAKALPSPPVPDSLQLEIEPFDTTRIRLNRSLVPTGILEDVGETPVDLHTYNGLSGLADSNYVNFQTLNGLLKGVSNSVVRGQSVPSDITIQMSNTFHNGCNPVGIVLYKYDRTRQFEPNDPIVSVVGDSFYDLYNGDVWVNPYEEKYTVAFSPYMNIVGNSVNYYFSANQLYTNLSNIDRILFDADDGYGFRQIDWNSPYVQTTYTSSTPKELKLRVYLTDNTMLETHSKVIVLLPATPPAVSSGYYTKEFTASNYYGSYLPKAQITVDYANGSSITKPLIVAEGFDPFTEHEPSFLQSTPTYGYNNIDTFNKYIGNTTLSTFGYDLIYIDWYNSAAPIEANADILKQVIEWVNLHNTGSEKSILIGQSMGGLIARYALCSMENANQEHNVKVYVSHDSPHFGVNVPVGALYLAERVLSELSVTQVRFVKDFLAVLFESFFDIYNIDTFIDDLFELRNAPSVKQMLMHYITPALQYDFSEYNSFQATLNSLGFPEGDDGEGIINLTVSNGGINNYSNNLNHLLHFDGSAYVGYIAYILGLVMSSQTGNIAWSAIGLMLSMSGPHLEVKIYPTYGANELVYEGEFRFEKQHGLLTGCGFGSKSQFYSPVHPRVLDSDAGSYYSLPALDSIPEPDGNILFGGYNLEVDLCDSFMFVPTVSSLAYRRTSQNIADSDRTIDFTALGVPIDSIPFQGYKFHTNASSYHTSIGSDEIKWIDRMPDLSIFTQHDTLHTGDCLLILDAALGKEPVSYSWSVTDTSFAQINSSTGQITVLSEGPTTVNADIIFKGGHYRLSKDIYVETVPFPGFPPYTLSKIEGMISLNGDFSGDYTIMASSSPAINSSYWPSLTCHWGKKANNNSPIQWTTSSYTPIGNKLYYYCNFDNLDRARMVYFYVSYRNQVSPTYSIFCRIPPALVLLDGGGNLYTEDLDTPFAQVKGDISDNNYYFCCSDKELVYDHWPTWAEFCTDMLTSEAFVAQIKTVRPWGEEDMIMIPYSYHSSSSEEEEYGFLTIKFDESL